MNPRAFRLDSKPFPVRTPGSRQDGALPHTPLSCAWLRVVPGTPWQSPHPAPSWQSLHNATFQGSGNHCFRGVSRRAMATPAPRASRRARAHAPGEERREQGRVPPRAADCAPWQSPHAAAMWQSLDSAPRGRVWTLPPVAESPRCPCVAESSLRHHLPPRGRVCTLPPRGRVWTLARNVAESALCPSVAESGHCRFLWQRPDIATGDDKEQKQPGSSRLPVKK